MIRIAQIKFDESSKIYDYLCDDSLINEGDVVFVEGTDSPLFVYDIKFVDEKDLKATKKVLKKAKVNDNVTLKTRYMNIINADTDCIVNSLGPKTSEFGAICKSIVNNAESSEIDKMLKEHKNGNIFDIFVTDSGKLKSKYIIHIITPFKKDDYSNKKLKKAFSLVIDKAIELGLSSIAIPYIGTGANGYSKEDVAMVMNKVLFEYQYKDNIKIEIVSIVYNSTSDNIRDVEKERLYYDIKKALREEPHKNGHFENKIPKYYSSDQKTQLILESIDKYYKGEDEFIPSKKFDNPIDYMRDYRRQKNIYSMTQSEVDQSLSRPNQTKVSSGERQIKKREIINIAISCRMNFTEFIQFMLFTGFSISTNSVGDVELALLKYLVENKRFNGICLTYQEIGYYVSTAAINTIYPI